MQIEIKNLTVSTLINEEKANVIIDTIQYELKKHKEKLNQKEYLSFDEAQKYLNIPYYELQKLIVNGLPAIVIDNIKKIKKSDIEDFINN